MSLSQQQVIDRYNQGKSGKGGNIISTGNVLYSYGVHFPMIARVTVNGVNITLGTYHSYSRTTANHLTKCGARNADFLVIRPTDNPSKAKQEIITALTYYLSKAQETALKAARARKHKQYHIDQQNQWLSMYKKATDLLAKGETA